MSKTRFTVTPKSGTSKLVRAKFGPGMLLHHEDLEQLNAYTRDLSRLMFRSFFGCGVVCGLDVNADEKCGKLTITVNAGLALDCNGDPVCLPKDQPFTVGDESEEIPPELWIVLCGTTKSCAPRTAMCASDDDEPASTCTRESDGYEIRVLSQRPECACGCDALQDNVRPKESDCKCVDPTLPCYADHYAGKCGRACNECSDCDGILLARLSRKGDAKDVWITDYRVRRFIRPVLMEDPEPKNVDPKSDQTATPKEPQPKVNATNDQIHAQQATAEPEDAEQSRRAIIAEWEKKTENAVTESVKMAKELDGARVEKGELERRLTVAGEIERQAIQQLRRVTEEKTQLEQQLHIAEEAKKLAEEQLLAMGKSESPSEIQMNTTKSPKKKAKRAKKKATVRKRP